MRLSTRQHDCISVAGRHSSASINLPRDAVRTEITGHDGGRSMHLERNDAADALAKMVSGPKPSSLAAESGVGKARSPLSVSPLRLTPTRSLPGRVHQSTPIPEPLDQA